MGRMNEPAVHVGHDLEAWLFDLDGVLTRTADLHASAWQQMFDRYFEQEGSRRRFDLEQDYLRYVDGRPRADGIRTYLTTVGTVLPEGDPEDAPDARTVYGLASAKNVLFLELLEHQGVSVYDTSINFVHILLGSGVRTAVVSASENTEAVLRRAGITDLFEVVIDGVVIRRRHLNGKPAPDSYLEAARQLGVTPARAAVVEDAVAGVIAGRAGRFGLVVGVDRTASTDTVHQEEALRSAGADVVVHDLGDLVTG